MKKTFFHKKVGQLVFNSICLILLFSFKTSAQIVLADEPIPIQTKEYYIAGVTDNRTEKSPVVQLIVTETTQILTKPDDLKGGTAVEISRFIRKNLPKDQYSRPVIINIKELKLRETAIAGGRVDGHVNLRLSFGLQKNYGTEHLVDYEGALHYIRSGVSTSVEIYIRSILKNGLTYFNDWINKNIDVNRKLVKIVKISFTDYTEQPEGDTIYYSPNRPLTWADFQSPNRPTGGYEALVIPGLGYNQQAQITKGTIHIDITMKTFLPKSASRASNNNRDTYTLNHEQRHFDIAKIITEQFKQKILAANLTPDNFEAFINMQYLDAYRDMDAMQKAYDNETRHGIDQAAQSMWNNQIDQKLKEGIR